MKKIGIVTGTRAEYGLLKPIITYIKEDSDLKLQLLVTGAHLSPEFGLTYQEIEKDGFHIDEKIEILLSSDTDVGISKAMGLALISFSEAFNRLKPDLLIILGDRYEMLSVAIAAMNAKIPIAHLHGGEATEGLIDEAIRHSITKMSYLHFSSTEEYRRRIIQLGESPQRVFNVGAIAIETIHKINYLSKEELKKQLGIDLSGKVAMLTYHPVTLEQDTAKEQMLNILSALDEYKDVKVIITKANSDMGGRAINQIIDTYVNKNPGKAVAFASLGQNRYFSCLKHCDFVIGNSSSGIIEVPSFQIPTINIGDRQKGRVQAQSIINCTSDKEDVVNAINKALSQPFLSSLADIQDPYGDGKVTIKIMSEIKKFLNDKSIQIKKEFYNL